jgi:hypothetical protein
MGLSFCSATERGIQCDEIFVSIRQLGGALMILCTKLKRNIVNTVSFTSRGERLISQKILSDESVR